MTYLNFDLVSKFPFFIVDRFFFFFFFLLLLNHIKNQQIEKIACVSNWHCIGTLDRVVCVLFMNFYFGYFCGVKFTVEIQFLIANFDFR
jgi:hypothetical protein